MLYQRAIAIVIITIATPSGAFCPPKICHDRTTFINSRMSSRQGGSALFMGDNLFDRFSRVAKSNLNNVLKKLEDPEKIMEQAVADMQGDLVKVRQSYAEITATQRRLMKQKEQAEELAEDWKKRAQLALEKGNEELAREALSRRQQQVDSADSTQNQISSQKENIDNLYVSMQELESRILEAKSKKDEMVARARTAQSTQKVNDMLSGVTGKTSMDAFSRMEEKVDMLEAAAEVSSEMGSTPLLKGSSRGVEDEFKMLEAGSAVDDELEKMKNLLAPSSGSKGPKEVDDELEQMKKDAGL